MEELEKVEEWEGMSCGLWLWVMGSKFKRPKTGTPETDSHKTQLAKNSYFHYKVICLAVQS